MTRGFTLIELLVVITIIVVLLALLTPALDKAVYQAQLAVCGAHQHAIAAGAITYAVGYQRRFPHRPALRQSPAARPIDIYSGSFSLAGANPVDDDRPVLREFIALNGHLNCPLTPGKIDIEGSDLDSSITSPYALWFGFQYRAAAPEQGMFKLGDRFTWQGDSFDVLVSDWDGTYTEGPLHITTHPDELAVLSPWVYQDQDWTGLVPAAGGPTKVTASYWSSTEQTRGVERGVMDTNYAHADGSVVRFAAVEWDEGDPDKNPERLTWVPQRGDGYNTNPTWQAHLPAQ